MTTIWICTSNQIQPRVLHVALNYCLVAQSQDLFLVKINLTYRSAFCDHYLRCLSTIQRSMVWLCELQITHTSYDNCKYRPTYPITFTCRKLGGTSATWVDRQVLLTTHLYSARLPIPPKDPQLLAELLTFYWSWNSLALSKHFLFGEWHWTAYNGSGNLFWSFVLK